MSAGRGAEIGELAERVPDALAAVPFAAPICVARESEARAARLRAPGGSSAGSRAAEDADHAGDRRGERPALMLRSSGQLPQRLWAVADHARAANGRRRLPEPPLSSETERLLLGLRRFRCVVFDVALTRCAGATAGRGGGRALSIPRALAGLLATGFANKLEYLQ